MRPDMYKSTGKQHPPTEVTVVTGYAAVGGAIDHRRFLAFPEESGPHCGSRMLSPRSSFTAGHVLPLRRVATYCRIRSSFGRPGTPGSYP